jgi:hypothetical protein
MHPILPALTCRVAEHVRLWNTEYLRNGLQGGRAAAAEIGGPDPKGRIA